MATFTQTQMQTRTDEEFSRLSDDEILEKYFEKGFDYDGLAGLTDRELDDWINDYVSHLPETHNLKKYEVPCMLNKKLKRIIREHI
jgi:hypothetical protein